MASWPGGFDTQSWAPLRSSLVTLMLSVAFSDGSRGSTSLLCPAAEPAVQIFVRLTGMADICGIEFTAS